MPADQQHAAQSKIWLTAGIILGAYAIVALVSGLSWPNFRDEWMYLEAIESTTSPDAPTFVLNVCAVGVFVWSQLWQHASESLALLRFSVLAFTFGCFALWWQIGRQMPEKPNIARSSYIHNIFY